MDTAYNHLPVMCDEVLALLAPALSRPQAVLIDATLGLGGHTLAALERFPGLRVIGIDRDPQALALARTRLARFSDRFEAHQATFDQIGDVSDSRVDGIMFDLGLSSLQIDAVTRGFSYSVDAPLSMRMDGDPAELTAEDVVNTYSAQELARIFRIYGDERHAPRIARAIVAEREIAPIVTSGRLAEIVQRATPASSTRSGHPAKRVFQAIRIEVNDERTLLTAALPRALAMLNLGGRMTVLSYHSGEDRMVKSVFARAGVDDVPPGMVVVPEQRQARFRVPSGGAVKPSQHEVESNPRSRSARLRVIESVKEEK